ncbi:MAG: MlaD family protein [Solirubrobacteraceae bacterium]|nr:MlaD family protein [Solirubrobacteraceae bacterium]
MTARRRTGIALVALLVAVVGALVATGTLPSGGDDPVEGAARFAGRDADVPGRGQRVTVAGVPVGRVLAVTRERDATVVRFSVAARHARLLRRDARATVRPETAVDDVALVLDPGRDPRSAKRPVRIATDRTAVRLSPDRISAALDDDAAAALRVLAGVGRDADVTGARLLDVAGRLDGVVRRTARAVERRRAAGARALRDLRRLADALVEHRTDLRRAAAATATTLDVVARRDATLRAALRELPATVRAADRALTGGARLVDAAVPALRAAGPSVDAAPATLRRVRTALDETLPALRDGLLPLVRDTPPALGALRRHADAVTAVLDDARSTTGVTERTLDALAYDPPGPTEGRLFWAQWLTHIAPWVVNAQDAHGPMARALLLTDCPTLRRVDDAARVAPAGALLGAVLRPPVTTGLCPPGDGGGR